MYCEECKTSSLPRGQVTMRDGRVLCYWCAFPREVPVPVPRDE